MREARIILHHCEILMNALLLHWHAAVSAILCAVELPCFSHRPRVYARWLALSRLLGLIAPAPRSCLRRDRVFAVRASRRARTVAAVGLPSASRSRPRSDRVFAVLASCRARMVGAVVLASAPRSRCSRAPLLASLLSRSELHIERAVCASDGSIAVI